MIRSCEQQNKPRKDEQKKINRQIEHNYSSYTLSDEQYEALSLGLDTQIPAKVKKSNPYRIWSFLSRFTEGHFQHFRKWITTN